MSEPQHLLGLLAERVAAQPNAAAATYKDGGVWREVSWRELDAAVWRAAAGFLRLGVLPGDCVSIFASTRYQWTIADLGAMAIGAAVAPIYASNTSEEARHILQDSGAVLCVVDDDLPDGRQPGRLSRLVEVWPKLQALKTVVVMAGEPGPDGRLLRWEDSLAPEATAAERAEIARRLAQLTRETLACLLYTSGTTGPPKGVELTHGNWVYEAIGAQKVGLMRSRERVLLFLPLAHSFAKVVEAAWLSLGFTLAFAESVDKVVDNCGEVHPSCLPSVPRIFEKVYLKVISDAASAPGLSGRLLRATLAAFDEFAQARIEGHAPPMRYHLLKRVVFPKIKARLDARLGGALRLFISGGAPLSRKLGLFFQELGFEILEGYGLSETSAGTCVNPPGHVRLGTVGPPFPGTEIRIAPDGEILVRGPGVMRGYHGHPEDTRAVMDSDGFFHTGDIGALDSAGYLRITDRKKDIIVTAGGKNVAPQNLENDLKGHAIISQAMVYGDRRKFLSALIAVNEDEARKLLGARGLPAEGYAELVKKVPVREAVDQAVQAINATLPPYETIKRYAILGRDFSQESGELTPTLKVKRKVVTQQYRAILDGFYDEKLIE